MLKLEDIDTKNEVSVQINIYNSEDPLEVKKQATGALEHALALMGFIPIEDK